MGVPWLHLSSQDSLDSVPAMSLEYSFLPHLTDPAVWESKLAAPQTLSLLFWAQGIDCPPLLLYGSVGVAM